MIVEKLEACPACGEVKRWLYDAQICAVCDHGSRYPRKRTEEDCLTFLRQLEHDGRLNFNERLNVGSAADCITRLLSAREQGIEAARRQALESAAKLAEDFSWQLPLYGERELNEVSDDTACAVQKQIAAAIRALAPAKEDGSDG